MAADPGESYRLDDYDYDLPPELIAQAPSAERQDSRLLVLDRARGSLEHSSFRKIGRFLKPGDLLVVNDTRVVPARLLGRKESGGRIELLVLDPYKPAATGMVEGHTCLVKASKGVRAGQLVHLLEGICAEVVSTLADGKARVKFPKEVPILEILDKAGAIPLPPYISRDAGPTSAQDRIRYQTEYARCPGAVAAPTAGLHFTTSLLNDLRAGGVETAAITLHVGYGTFAPIRCTDIREHRIHSEFVEIGFDAAESVNRAKSEGRRVVAVGTTVVRTLEWVHRVQGKVAPFCGMCDHYIYPGNRFEVIAGMITNFHLPKSSLILLVSALAGRAEILSAYGEAVRERYRFFSYGDAMLIL